MLENLLRILCEKVAGHLPSRSVIKNTGEPYLTRYYLLGEKPPGFPDTLRPIMDFLPFGVYLHHIHSSDTGPGYHNHPWDKSYSYILAGEYLEERLSAQPTRYLPGMVNTIGRRDFHKITVNQADVWTLFICGRRVGGWGFIDPAMLIYTPGNRYSGRVTQRK